MHHQHQASLTLPNFTFLLLIIETSTKKFLCYSIKDKFLFIQFFCLLVQRDIMQQIEKHNQR